MNYHELFRKYSLTECNNQEIILTHLDALVDKGLVDYIYEINKEVITIHDIDLSMDDLNILVDLFYDNDVIPDLDFEDLDEDIDLDIFEEYE